MVRQVGLGMAGFGIGRFGMVWQVRFGEVRSGKEGDGQERYDMVRQVWNGGLRNGQV